VHPSGYEVIVTNARRSPKFPGALIIFRLVCGVILSICFAGALTQSLAQDSDASSTQQNSATQLRVEVTPVSGGAELLTIWGYPAARNESSEREIPLLSVLRDTLGDTDKTNDLLRQLWVYTYTRPIVRQRIAAFIPFLYRRVGNKSAGQAARVPPAIIDLSRLEQETWKRFFVEGITQLALDQPLARFSANTYRRSSHDYRQSHLTRALSILSWYESQGPSPALTEADVTSIQARLSLTEKPFGGLIDPIHLQRFQTQEASNWNDRRGHNWELLRQQAESSGLYFEPLAMPDRGATHVMLWISRADLRQREAKYFNGRFLNIKNPWTDDRLLRWKGYTEDKYFSPEDGAVSIEASKLRRSSEMIPLAVYGLDFPKIPALLIDFRDSANPKRRELSRRVIDEVARNAFSLSKFGNLYYFFGRTAFDFVTSRRGVDISQPSRLRAYAELKLLLTLDSKISPALRDELQQRLEKISSNPLENDLQAEQKLARDQYQALVAWAQRSDGLAAALERERGEEMTKFVHSRKKRTLLRFANILSAGLYTHREKMSPQALAQLNKERQLDYHQNFLREVAMSTPVAEVTWSIEDVQRSLRYIAENSSLAGSSEVRAIARIFARTDDMVAKELCLQGLRRIENKSAKEELLRIVKSEQTAQQWRALAQEYLLVAAPPTCCGANSGELR
jgi:hypothetical protein